MAWRSRPSTRWQGAAFRGFLGVSDSKGWRGDARGDWGGAAWAARFLDWKSCRKSIGFNLLSPILGVRSGCAGSGSVGLCARITTRNAVGISPTRDLSIKMNLAGVCIEWGCSKRWFMDA
jgi:hypothetical protein